MNDPGPEKADVQLELLAVKRHEVNIVVMLMGTIVQIIAAVIGTLIITYSLFYKIIMHDMGNNDCMLVDTSDCIMIQK
jgi:hypothetical protein